MADSVSPAATVYVSARSGSASTVRAPFPVRRLSVVSAASAR